MLHIIFSLQYIIFSLQYIHLSVALQMLDRLISWVQPKELVLSVLRLVITLVLSCVRLRAALPVRGLWLDLARSTAQRILQRHAQPASEEQLRQISGEGGFMSRVSRGMEGLLEDADRAAAAAMAVAKAEEVAVPAINSCLSCGAELRICAGTRRGQCAYFYRLHKVVRVCGAPASTLFRSVHPPDVPACDNACQLSQISDLLSCLACRIRRRWPSPRLQGVPGLEFVAECDECGLVYDIEGYWKKCSPGSSREVSTG